MSDADAAFQVVAEGLWRSFTKGGRTIDVLRGIDLRLEPGEQVSVMGRSGAGKSTLLHLLGALDRPSAGSLRLGGRELSSLGDRELSALRCRHVGMVFQFHHLLPEFTAVENVIMPAVVAGETFEDARKRALQVLGEMELDHRLDHRPGELSGGEQQRVAIARALVHRPQLVLADEPTGNLDQRTGTAVHELLLDAIASRGAILVLVTHDPDLASSVERKLELREGVLEELT
jgi:lipoprotein-releasing system ATP-binding protein